MKMQRLPGSRRRALEWGRRGHKLLPRSVQFRRDERLAWAACGRPAQKRSTAADVDKAWALPIVWMALV